MQWIVLSSSSRERVTRFYMVIAARRSVACCWISPSCLSCEAQWKARWRSAGQVRSWDFQTTMLIHTIPSFLNFPLWSCVRVTCVSDPRKRLPSTYGAVATQSLQWELRRVVAAGPRLRFAWRVAGAVHRASRWSCGARGRRWAAAVFCVAGAGHRASRTSCGARHHLLHTIFHTPLCHTPSFTHNFVTPFLSHTTFRLSFTYDIGEPQHTSSCCSWQPRYAWVLHAQNLTTTRADIRVRGLYLVEIPWPQSTYWYSPRSPHCFQQENVGALQKVEESSKDPRPLELGTGISWAETRWNPHRERHSKRRAKMEHSENNAAFASTQSVLRLVANASRYDISPSDVHPLPQRQLAKLDRQRFVARAKTRRIRVHAHIGNPKRFSISWTSLNSEIATLHSPHLLPCTPEISTPQDWFPWPTALQMRKVFWKKYQQMQTTLCPCKKTWPQWNRFLQMRPCYRTSSTLNFQDAP